VWWPSVWEGGGLWVYGFRKLWGEWRKKGSRAREIRSASVTGEMMTSPGLKSGWRGLIRIWLDITQEYLTRRRGRREMGEMHWELEEWMT